jgi:hypothetical protein
LPFFENERGNVRFCFTGFLLNNLKSDFTVPTGKFEQRSTAFRTLNFLRRHKGEVSYAEKGKFKLSDLNLDFTFDCGDIGIFNLHFGVRKDGIIRFFASKGNIFAKVQDPVFLIPFPQVFGN